MLPRRACLLALFLLSLPAFAKSKDKYQNASPVHLDRTGERWAERTLKKLSLEEKVGQIFMIWVRAQFLNVNSPVYLQLPDAMGRYHLGSFLIVNPLH